MKKLFIWAMSAAAALFAFFAANFSLYAYAAEKDVSSLGLKVTLKENEFTYTGDIICPEYKLTGSTMDWTSGEYQGEGYSIGCRYNINAGTGRIVAEGNGEYSGQTTLATFTIKPLDIKDIPNLTINIGAAAYTGEPVFPCVDVAIGTRELRESVDYTISAENNTDIGYATGVVNFIGNYTGSRSIHFSIALAPINHFTVSASGSGNVLRWDSVKCDQVKVYRHDISSGTLALIGSTAGNEFTDNSFPQLSDCYYTVQSIASYNGTQYIATSYSCKAAAALKAPTPAVTSDNGVITVSWDSNPDADGYYLYMDGKLTAYLQGKQNTSYTVSGVSAADKHSFTVNALGYFNGQMISSPQSVPAELAGSTDVTKDPAENSSGTAKPVEEPGVLKNAVKGDTRTFVITDSQKQTNTLHATVTLSDEDIATLDRFASEHFTDGMSDTEKLKITFNWINRNVRYASAASDWNKISKSSYVDAIFNQKTGQCAQYNGAMVSMMRYLGYQANMVLGWRGSWPGNYWQHYWGEIEINGTKYIIECGNYGKSGNWSYFLAPYEYTDGKFIINCKNVSAYGYWYYY